ncbi:MAG: ABC transporter ATP-binding protein [Dehalococcoidia bacterium]
MLRLSGIGVSYGRTAAVRDVSLSIEQGEIVGLIGSNGAGKTTTLRAIAGLRRPEKGDITFEGQSLVGAPPEEIVRRGIAMVPEGRRIFSSLTVSENLKMGTICRPRDPAVGRDVKELEERFPILRTASGTRAGQLSGGEQQQLALARALLTQPRLLLLDEPSLGLAPKVVTELFEVLTRLRDEGTTILLVEQNARKTLDLADRTYVLRSGRVAVAGSREELRNNLEIEAAYLGTRGPTR